MNTMPASVLKRMQYLEAVDTRDRTDGTPRLERLRQIPPETGRFIALWAMASPAGDVVEIGTSAGYSTLWLALACRRVGRTLTTYELLHAKAALARETIAEAGVADVVTLVHGDARPRLSDHRSIGFCFLDAEKDVYLDCYELVVPRLAPGGILIADNAINHRQALAGTIERALSDTRVDAMVVPIGKGELVVRKAARQE